MDNTVVKSKSIRDIEQKMASVGPGSLRYRVLESARNFKSSWIALGQILYSVYKDKIFKEWGYQTFEAYCKAELGLQQPTALKLLHSYYFLEKNESDFLKSVTVREALSPKNIPSVDAVNALRLAANKKELTQDDYQEFKRSVFDEGKDGQEVKKQIGLRLRSLRQEEDPQKARQEHRMRTLRRCITTLKTIEKEVVYANLVSGRVAKEIELLLEHLSLEIAHC